MAAGPPAERLRDEARCPVCLDFLQEPVSVDCGHSFCLRCISEFCQRSDGAQGGVYACPQCRGPFRPAGFRPNRQLAGLVEGVRQLGLGAGPGGPAGARRCARHGEDLSRFCEEDGAALCRVCDAGPEHATHRTAPLQDAAGRYQRREGETRWPSVRSRQCAPGSGGSHSPSGALAFAVGTPLATPVLQRAHPRF
ncbi:E3 ubiquitin-protein ligase trim58 [Saguinus oedipus]|uniref:E3 ubiquitin-protein ligase trim58 n=1 Tax=Saguinus oedipus TaxID=9490 RepID=A0ABQ9TM33_SAGOE|nr:E3 ubiquitin-protein ligase trim58 [Saguinus oedipus]